MDKSQQSVAFNKQKYLTNEKETPNVKLKNNYYRHSFERFGSDLTEVILSYLSIDDKIRLELVSKRWQFTIVNVAKVFAKEKYFVNNRRLLKKHLELILEKCKNVTNIRIDYRHRNSVVMIDSLLCTIADKCINLQSLSINFVNVEYTQQILRYFWLKVSPKLRSMHLFVNVLDINTRSLISVLLSSCTKLENIRLNYKFDFEYHIGFNSNGATSYFINCLAMNCSNTLKQLDFEFNGKDCVVSVESLSRMDRIKKLTIRVEVGPVFVNFVKQFAKRCAIKPHLCIYLKGVSID